MREQVIIDITPDSASTEITTSNRTPQIYAPFSIWLQNRICDLAMEGYQLKDMHTVDPEIPSGGRIARELSQNQSFKRAYEQAKEVYAHILMEENIKIADDGSNDTYMTNKGLQVNFDHIKRSELRIKTREKLAEKYNVPYYGKVDRSEINVNRTSYIANMSSEDIARRLDEIKEKAMKKLEAQQQAVEVGPPVSGRPTPTASATPLPVQTSPKQTKAAEARAELERMSPGAPPVPDPEEARRRLEARKRLLGE